MGMSVVRVSIFLNEVSERRHQKKGVQDLPGGRARQGYCPNDPNRRAIGQGCSLFELETNEARFAYVGKLQFLFVHFYRSA